MLFCSEQPKAMLQQHPLNYSKLAGEKKRFIRESRGWEEVGEEWSREWWRDVTGGCDEL